MNIYRRLGLSFHATATAGHAARHTTPSLFRSSFSEQRHTISTDVSPGQDDTVFRSRLRTIWEGLSAFPKTQRWEETLSSKTPEFWLSQIEQHTAKQFKTILSSHQPPTISVLDSLEWSDTTTAAGVYLWVWKPKRKRTYHDSECYLYLGSATQFGAGLADKRRVLLSTWPSTRQQPPKPQMRDLGMSPTSKMVTLFEVPFENESDEQVRTVRSLVAVARAVFVIWLGAVKDPLKPTISSLTPWQPLHIQYHGLASQNPLLHNIVDPEETRRRRDDEERRRFALILRRIRRSIGEEAQRRALMSQDMAKPRQS